MILYWLALLLVAVSGVPGLLLRRNGGAVSAALLGLGAALGITEAVFVLFGGAPWSCRLPASPLGSPGFVSFDAIAAFFAVPVLLIPACGALFGVRYWGDQRENAKRVRLFYGLLCAFLLLLVASSHTITFLVGWEGMAIAAFFLVITEDREPSTQRAAWIYLVATHTGTLCMCGAFALMASASGSFALSALPPGFASSARGVATFALFMLGFGFKAGVFPLHFWLPPAHAAAPSHVSSFMSGVLIKMGILGMVRLLAWIPDPPLWWGGLFVALGAVSGILGVAFALGQHDLKRLLAYHSIENIGIILLGLGLGTLGKSAGRADIMLLGYAGGLLHVLNHGLFKGLLFLSAGSVVHATGTRDIERLGGLAKAMPGSSAAFLLGAWAICGLPPLNGFVSEWLVYLAAFRGLVHAGPAWSGITLVALALIGALALACFAKAFGMVFLGNPRSAEAAGAHESPRAMLIPLGVLAGACILIGLAPAFAVSPLNRVAEVLAGGRTLPNLAHISQLQVLSWIALPATGLGFLFWIWSRRNSGRRDLPTWDCGYAAAVPRAQYTASSFADGLVSGMGGMLRLKTRWKRITACFPSRRHFESHVPDPVLDLMATPTLDFSARKLALLRFFQSGHLPVYLLYVMLTLLLLLTWMVW